MEKNKFIADAQCLDWFKDECEKWIAKLGLTGWTVYYSFTPKDEEETEYASCSPDYMGCKADIQLSRCWDEKCPPTEANIRQSAKHEIIHLLLANLTALARNRFVVRGELEKAEEAITIKLERVLK